MGELTYTLKEVVVLLSPQGDKEEHNRLARQLRHWTMLDLLSPEGKKHTGTGVSRKYGAREIRKAAILQELSRYHVPVTVLDRFSDVLSDEARGKEWAAAIKGSAPVFLNFAFAEHSVTWKLTKGHLTRDFFVPLGPEWESKVPTSGIVMNLTRIFARLKL